MVLEFRVALIQILTDRFRENNLAKIAKMVKEATKKGAHIVILPVRNRHRTTFSSKVCCYVYQPLEAALVRTNNKCILGFASDNRPH